MCLRRFLIQKWAEILFILKVVYYFLNVKMREILFFSFTLCIASGACMYEHLIKRHLQKLCDKQQLLLIHYPFLLCNVWNICCAITSTASCNGLACVSCFRFQAYKANIFYLFVFFFCEIIVYIFKGKTVKWGGKIVCSQTTVPMIKAQLKVQLQAPKIFPCSRAGPTLQGLIAHNC